MLLKDQQMSEKYNQIIIDYVNKHYCRKLSDEEVTNERKKTWYLPNFPVVNENKPGKVRMVFDAAAKSFGRSLNDFWSTSPDLLKLTDWKYLEISTNKSGV